MRHILTGVGRPSDVRSSRGVYSDRPGVSPGARPPKERRGKQCTGRAQFADECVGGPIVAAIAGGLGRAGTVVRGTQCLIGAGGHRKVV